MNSKLPNQITVPNGIGRSGLAIQEERRQSEVCTQRTPTWRANCRCSDQGGPKPTSKCCVTLSWMVMQGEHTGVYPGSGKRRPYVQRGREVCISLHRGARVGVTSRRERVSSPSLKEKKEKDGCFAFFPSSFAPLFVALACPFIGREEAKSRGALRRCFVDSC
jgi:hypothetical protein